MSDAELAKRFSPLSFGLAWVVSAVLTWGSGCLLALVLLYNNLHAGLLPAGMLLALALLGGADSFILASEPCREDGQCMTIPTE